MNQVTDFIISKTVRLSVEIAQNNGHDLDDQKATKYIKDTAAEKIPAILKESQEDAKSGDVFGGLGQGRIDPLAMEAGKIGLVHGCTKWAKEICEQCKQEAEK